MKPILISIIVAAAVSAACTSARPQPAAEAPQRVEDVKGRAATAAQCEAGKEPWRAQGSPKRGGTLTMGALDIADLDQNAANTQVRNSLLTGRGCFPTDTAVVPGLAKSWDVSTDGLTWTLKLRDDVKWHNLPPVNGRQFTSADVGWMIDYQNKGGIAVSNNLKVYWENVIHSEPDPYTVVLKLKEPDADFAGKLASGVNLMEPKEVGEANGNFKTVSVGTGSFQVKDFKPQDYLLLTANPAYYEKGDDGKPLPYVDELRLIRFADYTAELAAVRSGQLDSTDTFGLRKLDADDLVKSNPKFKQWVLVQPTQGTLWFDPKKKPWDDARVRKAVALSVNRDDLVVSDQGGVALSGFIPASFQDYAWPEAKLKEKFKPDIAQAKKLLADAGYVNPPGLKIQTVQDYAQEAEVVQAGLKNIGIDAGIEVTSDRSWTTTLIKGQFELGWGAVGGAIVDNVGFWASDLLRTGSSLNYARFSDPKFDQMAAAQAKEMDPTKRKQAIDAIQDYLYEVWPNVPSVSRIYYNMLSCRTKNFKLVHLGRNPSGPMYAWLDNAGC